MTDPGLDPTITTSPVRPHDPGWYCHGRNRRGEPCAYRAGRGTDHVGAGLCHLHGGSSPGGKIQAEKIAARSAIEALGIPGDGDPRAALAAAVSAARGMHDALARLVREATEADELALRSIVVRLGLFSESIDRLARVAKLATDANLGERQVRIAEEQGRVIVEVLRSAMARAGLGDYQRAELERHLGAAFREYAATQPQQS